MIPPICKLCGKDFSTRWLNTGQGGVFIRFADQWGMWFCDEHAEEAQKREGSTSDIVLNELREVYSLEAWTHPKEYDDVPDPQLRIIDTGPNIAKVITIVKEATGLTSKELLDLIKQRNVPEIEGTYTILQGYQERLEEIGADSEIFFNDQEIPPMAPPDLSIRDWTREKERKSPPPEYSFTLPLQHIPVLLIVSILVGIFFGTRWVQIGLGGLVLVGIISLAVLIKIEKRREKK
ncbi:hypothetical protein ACFL47_07020 [Candidatus Latescibacterota bacterium]